MKILPTRIRSCGVEMLGDILEINEELGITVLYVTNKQEEAAGLKKKTVS